MPLRDRERVEKTTSLEELAEVILIIAGSKGKINGLSRKFSAEKMALACRNFMLLPETVLTRNYGIRQQALKLKYLELKKREELNMTKPKWDNDFRPLHKSLTITESLECSERSGKKELGLFAIEEIPSKTFLGVSHVKLPGFGFHQDLFRSTCGGVINSSSPPNCKFKISGSLYLLYTISAIKPGEELFVDYSEYSCGTSNHL